jgi:signal transduction histidine kinase
MHALNMDDCTLMLYDNVQDTLMVELNVNRSGDERNTLKKGTIFDLFQFPSKMRAVRERQVVVIRRDDPKSDKRELADMDEQGDIARMLVPLSAGPDVIGLLQVDLHDQMRTFTHREIRMAQALGAQAATKIENARLSTETAAQVEQGILINELSRAISSTMDIHSMIRIIREQIPMLTEANEVYLALLDSESGEITFPMAVSDGKDIEIPPRQMTMDEVSFVLRTRRPLSLGSDYPSIEEVRNNLGIVNGEGDITRYLGVPLIAGDQMLGVLAVRDNMSPRPFGLNDQRILTTVGTQLGAAIQNARLFQRINSFADELTVRVEERTVELQTERDRLESLYRITSEMGRTLDMERVLNRALTMVADSIKADDAVVLMLDPATDRLYSRAFLHPIGSTNGAAKNGTTNGTTAGTTKKKSKRAAASQPKSITLGGTGGLGELERVYHPAEMLGNWLLKQQDSVLVNDLRNESYWKQDSDGADVWRSALGVVLQTGEDVQGAIVFLGRKPRMFSEAELKLVVAASNQVATAINNADLYTLLREQTERLGNLLRTEREEAEKNSAILEGIADGVMLADANGNVVLFNGAAERILELPRDFALGQPLSRLAGVYGGGQTWVNMLNEWIKTPRSGDAAPRIAEPEELVVDRLDVGRRVISVHASPVYTGDQFLGTVSVFRDVTKDVEVDRMKSEFISNVSHELRTPMTSIKGYADLLLMGAAGVVTDQQRHFLTTIKNNAERLSNLVNDLLNISKLDSGSERLKLETFDVGEVIDQVVAGIQARADNERKHITVTTNIPVDLPLLTADRLKVSQILTNLVDNSFNYTYAGGKIEIEAQLDDDPSILLISVTDNGIGIPKEFQSRIWERFERYEEHALVMEVAGTGLGLSIVKDLVHMHGGKVWVESEVNEGSTFSVTLPVAGLDSAAAADTTAQPAPLDQDRRTVEG